MDTNPTYTNSPHSELAIVVDENVIEASIQNGYLLLTTQSSTGEQRTLSVGLSDVCATQSATYNTSTSGNTEKQTVEGDMQPGTLLNAEFAISEYVENDVIYPVQTPKSNTNSEDEKQPVDVISEADKQPVDVVSEDEKQPVDVVSEDKKQPVNVVSEDEKQPVDMVSRQFVWNTTCTAIVCKICRITVNLDVLKQHIYTHSHEELAFFAVDMHISLSSEENVCSLGSRGTSTGANNLVSKLIAKMETPVSATPVSYGAETDGIITNVSNGNQTFVKTEPGESDDKNENMDEPSGQAQDDVQNQEEHKTAFTSVEMSVTRRKVHENTEELHSTTSPIHAPSCNTVNTGVDVRIADSIPRLDVACVSKRRYNMRKKTCPQCDRTLNSLSAFKKHQKHHSEANSGITCEKCDKTFISVVDQMEHHVNVHLKSEPLSCPRCEKKFTCKSRLKTHMVFHTKTKEHVCSSCSRTFFKYSELEAHMRSHTGESGHVCHYCGKSFYDHANLARHQKLHTGEKRHKCPYCDKAFTRSDDLKSHQMHRHADRDPHASQCQCSECGSIFSSEFLLKKHLRVHKKSGACGVGTNRSVPGQNFVCNICRRSFTDRNNMTRHQKLHMGIKPYQCSDCDKSFARAADLRTHQSRSGIHNKSNTCPSCDQRFTTIKELKTHQMSHSAVRPHGCPVCQKSFMTAAYLQRHVSTYH